MKHLSGALTEQNVIFWGLCMLGGFWPMRAVFVVGEPLGDVGIHLSGPLTEPKLDVIFWG